MPNQSAICSRHFAIRLLLLNLSVFQHFFLLSSLLTLRVSPGRKPSSNRRTPSRLHDADSLFERPAHPSVLLFCFYHCSQTGISLLSPENLPIRFSSLRCSHSDADSARQVLNPPPEVPPSAVLLLLDSLPPFLLCLLPLQRARRSPPRFSSFPVHSISSLSAHKQLSFTNRNPLSLFLCVRQRTEPSERKADRRETMETRHHYRK